MKNSRILITVTGSLILWGACTKDFEETNTHPNQLQDITPASMLNPTIHAMAERNLREARDKNFGLMQVFFRPDIIVDEPFLYDLRKDVGTALWNNFYLRLSNIKEMEEVAIREERPNYEAIALTLRAYAFSMLTDCFGDVPYEEALQGEDGVLLPGFDPQKDIYESILDGLERANGLYDPSEEMLYVEDILYHNDVEKWQKFTNSLHLRLLLRVSDRTETNAFSKMVAMINNPVTYPVFTSNDDGAVLVVTGQAPNLSPWDRPQDFGVFRHYSAFFIDNLKDFDDPRLPIFATVARGLDNEDYGYIGRPIDFMNNPMPDSIATPSGIPNALVTEPMIIPFMSYGELELIKAELGQRGYLPEAEEHYKNGVQASIELWGTEVPEGYFDNEFTEYDGTLERIMLQKYYTLYFTDYQSWLEHRRTGFPELPTSPSMLNDGVMPSRFYYPPSTVDLNNSNYQQAVQQMGGDDINTKVWWDID